MRRGVYLGGSRSKREVLTDGEPVEIYMKVRWGSTGQMYLVKKHKKILDYPCANMESSILKLIEEYTERSFSWYKENRMSNIWVDAKYIKVSEKNSDMKNVLERLED